MQIIRRLFAALPLLSTLAFAQGTLPAAVETTRGETSLTLDVGFGIRAVPASRVTVPVGETLRLTGPASGGRPVQAVHKAPVTLRLDAEVLAAWRSSGKGWQTRAAQALATLAPKLTA